MMWQERQNCVRFERSMCSEVPIATQSSGRMKSARKARILPPRVAVMDGQKTRTAIRTMLRPIRMTRISVGVITMRLLRRGQKVAPNGASIPFCPRCSFLLAKLPDVGDQLLDLLSAQGLAEPRHLVLALGADLNELRIGLVLDFGGTKVPSTKFLSCWGIATAVNCVTHGALAFVDRLDGTLPRRGQYGRECDYQNQDRFHPKRVGVSPH